MRRRPLLSRVRAESMKDTIIDILAALTVAGALLIGALAYFDILTK
jgi:hypothetical protein